MKHGPPLTNAFHLFQAHFRQLLRLGQPLSQFADMIDWPRFDAVFAGARSCQRVRGMAGIGAVRESAFHHVTAALGARCKLKNLGSNGLRVT
jgi:hypothetical protein